MFPFVQVHYIQSEAAVADAPVIQSQSCNLDTAESTTAPETFYLHLWRKQPEQSRNMTTVKPDLTFNVDTLLWFFLVFTSATSTSFRKTAFCSHQPLKHDDCGESEEEKPEMRNEWLDAEPCQNFWEKLFHWQEKRWEITQGICKIQDHTLD